MDGAGEKVARRLVWGFLIVLLVVGPWRLPSVTRTVMYQFDFFLCWSSAVGLERGMPDIYGDAMAAFDKLLSHDRWSFPDNHPPPYYLFFAAYAHLDFDHGFWIHNLLSVVAYGCGVWMLAAFLRLGHVVAALAFVATMLCGIGVDNVYYGQIDFMAFLLLVGMLRLVSSGRSVAGGACLGIAILMKGFPAFLLVWLLMRRDWKAVLAAFAAPLLLCLLAAGRWGLADFRAYLEHDRYSSYYVLLLNQSIMGWLVRHVSGWPVWVLKLVHVTLGVLFGLAVGGLCWGQRDSRDPLMLTLQVGCFLMAAMLCAPFSWSHHHVMTAFLMLGLLAAAQLGRLPPRRLAAMLAAVLVYWLAEGETVVWGTYYTYDGPLLMMFVLLAVGMLAVAGISRSADQATPR